MIQARTSRSANAHRGFSLIELLLAIFILGIGIISIAAVFPAGIIQQRRTQDDVMGPAVAEAAMATLRSRLSPADFGTLEEFGLGNPLAANLDTTLLNGTFPDTFLSTDDWFTVPGDWAWMRPSMAVLEDPAGTVDLNNNYVGDIDIFSARKARSSQIFGAANYNASSGILWNDSSVVTTTELQPLPDFPLTSPLWPGVDQGAALFGIPFNRSKYDFFGFGEDPLITITQEERLWPVGSGYGTGQTRPQYAWECMFRRHQGRIQVAIFVYRITGASQVPGGYMAVQDQEGANHRPVLPARLDLYALDGAGVQDAQVNRLVAESWTGSASLTPMGNDDAGNEPYLRAEVPGTDEDFGNSNATNPISMNPYFLGWQSPGQWFLDPYGRIHRVVQGRRNRMKGPVRLARAIPNQPNTATNWNWLSQLQAQGIDPSSPEAAGRASEVRSIWFMPTSDARGIKLTPVYATVREL